MGEDATPTAAEVVCQGGDVFRRQCGVALHRPLVHLRGQ
jgi:hypothetical protein